MYNLNRAQILGNLTRDPEMRYTANGQAVTSFAIATNRSWTDNDGNRQDQTEFHDVVAWGKLAEIASQVLKKGQPAYIEGRLQTRTWDGQDGNRRQKTEIIIENIIALNGRAPGTGGPNGAPTSSGAPSNYDPSGQPVSRGNSRQIKDGPGTFMAQGSKIEDEENHGSAPAEPPAELSKEELDDIPF